VRAKIVKNADGNRYFLIAKNEEDLTQIDVDLLVNGSENVISILYPKHLFSPPRDERKSDVYPELITRELNRYWETLTDYRKRDIFDTYYEIFDTIDPLDVNSTIRNLPGLIKKLLDFHPEKELWNFLRDEKIVIPESVVNPVTYSDERKTYTKEKYDHLLVLGLALKVVLPIFAAFHELLVSITTKEYVDISTYRLLALSWVVDSRGIKDLSKYVQVSLEYDGSVKRTTKLKLERNLSEDDYHLYVLSRTVSTILSCKELSGDGNTNNLMSRLQSLVVDNIIGSGLCSSNVKSKHNRSNMSSDEDKDGLLEEYKVKPTINAADEQLINYYAKDVLVLAKEIEPDVDEALLEEVYRFNHNSETLPTERQRGLLSLVTSPCLPLKSLSFLDPVSMTNAITVGQVVLMHWGFGELAVYLTSIERKSEMASVRAHNNYNISSDVKERLLQTYPFSFKHTSKREVTPVRLVDGYAKYFMNTPWEFHAHDKVLAAQDPRVNLKNNIAEMLIYKELKRKQAKGTEE
jgi:hypothetical protein